MLAELKSCHPVLRVCDFVILPFSFATGCYLVLLVRVPHVLVPAAFGFRSMLSRSVGSSTPRFYENGVAVKAGFYGNQP